MNRIVLLGRLTRDIELKRTSTDTAFCNFTVAVDRKFKNKAGEYEADFISCVAWRNTAEFLAKYFNKGKPIALEGTLQTRNYEDDDGKRVYVTEVNVESVSFVPQDSGTARKDEYMPKTDTVLPFDL